MLRLPGDNRRPGPVRTLVQTQATTLPTVQAPTVQAPKAQPTAPSGTTGATATPTPTADLGTNPDPGHTSTPSGDAAPTQPTMTDLSQEEKDCLGPEILELMNGGETEDIAILKSIIGCLTDASINQMFLVEPMTEDGPLSDTTVACMHDSAAAPALREAMASISEDQEESMDAFWIMMKLTIGAVFASLDCMDREERAIYGTELDLDDAGINCVIDALEQSGDNVAAVLMQDDAALVGLEQHIERCRTTQAPTPTVPEEPTGPDEPTGAAPIGCADFLTRDAAQQFFLAEGGPADDPYHLDTNGDGLACNSTTDQAGGIFPPVLTPGEEQHAARARSLAASLLGIPPEDADTLVLAVWEPATWSNGALGCPDPGSSYTQAIVEGWRAVFATPEGEGALLHVSPDSGIIPGCR